MKDYNYVYHMLKRAEMKKRKAFDEDDEVKFFSYSTLVRQLKIILEVDKPKSPKNRLKKVMEFNDNLIK